ncbi:hypothetical protein EA462_06205 [Natrarchaeobius halalkaliphilus]|uniref:Uncharacterized protein n=1 Tax=Natrarchaeobius halalkaliphilus TaxID=1679091 RepID=A0A3N6LPU1_9EURY|nr:hypothetical protein [Natrarchaeobius halalkaliphilus]RQG91548.1 hypothetical protein EA462_06205 [Natrarchaeobius halalkaliphilus]
MFESVDTLGTIRNLGVYAIGVGLAAVGALGLADAIDFSIVLSGAFFVLGLALVVAVHEFFGGPI